MEYYDDEENNINRHSADTGMFYIHHRHTLFYIFNDEVKMRLEKHKPTDMALSYIFLMVFMVILIVMACWAIDISVSSLLVTKYVADSTLTNGFWFTDPAKLYHIALYIVVFFTACLSFLCGRLIINNYRYKLLLEQHGISTNKTK